MEGKKDDDTVKEVEEQEDPKPNLATSAPHTPTSKPSFIKASQDTTRSPAKATSATPGAALSDTHSKIPEEQASDVPVPAEKISVAQPHSGQLPEVLLSPGPTTERTPSATLVPDGPVSHDVITPSTQLSESSRSPGQPSRTKTASEATRHSGFDKTKTEQELLEDFSSDPTHKKRATTPGGFVGCLTSGLSNFDNFSCSKLIAKRNPFVHNPPRPEERRPRIERPRSPRDYIINLREDLADFQESHGLPRSRDYSFMSLGLALAQETARAICSVFLMFSELFPVIAIISLVLRFALDKLIDILETHEPVPKLKKTLIFCLQMVMILIPLWILIGTIVLPLAGLLFSIFRKLLRFKGGKGGRSCSYSKKQVNPSVPKKIDPPKPKAASCSGSSG